MEAEFNDDDVKTLFNGGQIEKIITKKDGSKTWKQKLAFNPETGQFDFISNNEEELTSYHCPCCQESLYKNGLKLKCKGCGFNMWTQAFKKTFSDKEISQLLEQRVTEKPVTGLKKKNGDTFSARLCLKIENGTEGNFGFVK